MAVDGPGVVVGRLEALLARPLKSVQHCRGTIVVADKVILAVVEDDRVRSQQIRDLVTVRHLEVVWTR